MSTPQHGTSRTALVGVGIDIERVDRFRGLPYSQNALFYERLFSPREIRYCLARRPGAAHFAARFAAKEAAVKALGGKEKDVRAFEVVSRSDTQPRLAVKGFPRLVFFLSLAHTREYALAIVVALRR